MKRLGSGDDDTQRMPAVLSTDQRDLLDRIIVGEREIASLRAREARLTEAVRWAAMNARGLSLPDVAELLESLLIGSKGG